MRSTRSLVALAAAFIMAATASAQDTTPERQPPPRRPGPDAQQLSPEVIEAAWQLQARSVSGELKLSEDQIKKVTETYLKARKSHAETLRAKLEEVRANREAGNEPPERGRGGMATAMAEATAAARKELEAGLAAAIGADLTAKAIVPLGTFDRAWDGMVAEVIGFKLEAAKTSQVLVPIQAYVVAVTKARSSDDREGVREAVQAERGKLEKALEPLLTKEQIQAVLQSGGRGGFGRGGRGGAEGRRPGGRGGDPGDPPV
jgi:Spy/CpxP family protein refolding chaperone